MSKKGKFFVFEGSDGSGKSTRKNIATEYLISLGINVVSLAEPIKNEIGGAIRKIASNAEKKLPFLAQAFLFTANRAYSYEEIIQPALMAGNWVVMDRSWLSTIVYQGYAEGFGNKSILDTLDIMTKIAIKETVFDLCVLCDAPTKTLFSRIGQRGQKKDYFEQKDMAFFERVRNGYLKCVERYPHLNFHVLDTEKNVNGDMEIATKEIREILKPYLGGYIWKFYLKVMLKF